MSWKTTNKIFFLIIFIIACYPKREPFEGSAFLPISPSIYKYISTVIIDFENKYPKARINAKRTSCREAVDSLLNQKTEQIVIDRPFTHPESLAFQKKNRSIYVFRIARMPLSFIVNSENPINELDSVELADILTGKINHWNQITESDPSPIRVYLPQVGEGVFELIQKVFSRPNQFIAQITDSDSIELKVAVDKFGLGAIAGIASKKVKPLGIRFNGKLQRPTLRAIYEKRYPWVLPITYITTKDEVDVATSFLNFMSSREGQKILSDLNTLPSMIPIKVTVKN